jgi:hypothetical protein
MRVVAAIAIILVSSALAAADCPPDCVAGGGPAATDCCVEYGGITSQLATCTDGDACDADGKADGVCTFPLTACINVGACPGPLSRAPTVKGTHNTGVQTFAAALAALDPAGHGCTPAGVKVPVKVGLPGLKPGITRLNITAAAAGKRDKDKLKLTCLPSTVAPSLANDVQPIITTRCAISACHSGPSPSAGQNLEAGNTYATDINVHSTDIPRFLRVKPGSLKQSFLARKILGKGIPGGLGGALMPQGCPGVPPSGGCLTPDEIYVILSWIQNGAPNN